MNCDYCGEPAETRIDEITVITPADGRPLEKLSRAVAVCAVCASMKLVSLESDASWQRVSQPRNVALMPTRMMTA